MDLIRFYADDDDDETAFSSPESSPPRVSPAKSSAVAVEDAAVAEGNQFKSWPIDPSQQAVFFNPTYDQLWAPIQGPVHPYAQRMRNYKRGFVEDASIDSFVFDEQCNTFHKYGYATDKYGYATDPSGMNFVGDLEVLKQNNGVSVYNIVQSKRKRRRIEKKEEKEPEVENPATDAWLRKNKKSPWAVKKEVVQGELTEEQKKYVEEHARKKGRHRGKGKGEHHVDKSTFHGKEEKDYQGRSWIAPPKDAKPNNKQCHTPNRLVHSWRAHANGVSAIRFFPKYGHLILSAGMDSKVKIWDVRNSSKCMRTYMGHSSAVKDICFSNDGTKFLTAGYDHNIKYWDTETGKVISTFSTGKIPIPYVVKLNPDDDKQNILLAGMSDKKLVHWDMDTGKVTQQYNQHLGAVNTITFVDDNRRFITSSDDMSLRVWDFGMPVVIKCISEPHMHSMPSIAVHPNSNWLAAQSLEN